MMYVFVFLGGSIMIFLLGVVVQLTRIERTLKETYFYTERKVKIFFENEDDNL